MKSGLDLYYPRSFPKLLLLALGLVALPLVLALVSASFYVERLAEQSGGMVGQAAQAARSSRQLVEQVTGMERAARQYLILDDRSLITDYESVRAEFRKTANELSLLPLDQPQLRALNQTVDQEAQLYRQLKSRAAGGSEGAVEAAGLTAAKPQTSGANPSAKRAAARGDALNPAGGPAANPAASPAVLVEGYGALDTLARGLLDIGNTMTDREIDNLRATASHAQSLLWWRLAIAVLAGLIVALGVSWLVAKPIRQIDRGIRALGDGRFDAAIRVSGPEDLVYLGNRLDWLRQRLLELENQKRLFLRQVSHELKTPLTSLREGAELLADGTAGPLAPAQAEIVAILRKQGAQLQRQIEELLDYQRVQDSISRHVAAPVALERVVADSIESHRLEAAARAIRVEARMQPVTLQGDAQKLRIVVDNLLSNAIKYSPDNAMVSCLLAQSDHHAQLDFIDNGPGIPPAEREKIFDWFFRGEYGHHGRMQGSGMGLAIARDFITAHGGSIAVVEPAEVHPAGGNPAGVNPAGANPARPVPGAHFRVILPLAYSRAAVES